MVRCRSQVGALAETCCLHIPERLCSVVFCCDVFTRGATWQHRPHKSCVFFKKKLPIPRLMKRSSILLRIAMQMPNPGPGDQGQQVSREPPLKCVEATVSRAQHGCRPSGTACGQTVASAGARAVLELRPCSSGLSGRLSSPVPVHQGRSTCTLPDTTTLLLGKRRAAQDGLEAEASATKTGREVGSGGRTSRAEQDQQADPSCPWLRAPHSLCRQNPGKKSSRL